LVEASLVPATLHLFAQMLAHNTGLRKLSLSVNVGVEDTEQQLVAPLHAIRDVLHHNSTLHTLKLKVWIYDYNFWSALESGVGIGVACRALDELEEIAEQHPTCTLRLKRENF
jgi:hypothetical protein